MKKIAMMLVMELDVGQGNGDDFADDDDRWDDEPEYELPARWKMFWENDCGVNPPETIL